MPNTKSAKKALRQNARKRARNITRKSNLKKVIKQYKKLIAAKKIEEAREQLPSVYKQLDKSVKTNLIMANKAARLKSQLSKLLPKK